MTGRAAGYCAGFSAPGYVNPPVGGGGFGRRGGRGGGRGRRNMYYATGMPGWNRAAQGMPAGGWPGAPQAAHPAPSAQQQMDVLKREAEFLEQQLNEIRQHLSALENEKVEQ